MTAMQRIHVSSRRPVFGFSLVEVMVGIAIGLIGMLVMFRMVSVWDSHTRTTTAGSDAEVTGTLAMFNLERDIRQGGMGFGTAAAPDMGCTVQVHDASRGDFTFPMYPVQIAADPADPAGTPQAISILHGNSSFFVSTAKVKSSTPTTNVLEKDQRNGFKPGDLAILAGNPVAGTPASATCALLEITADKLVPDDGASIAHTTDDYTSFYVDPAAVAATHTPRFNPAAGTPAALNAGNLYNLGPAPQLNTWQIANKRVLQRSDLIQNAAFDVAEGVINLQAQYGVDLNADGKITDGEWTATAPADWTKVLAIRVAMLVRSKHYERGADIDSAAATAVTSVEPSPSWTGGKFLMTNVDGSGDSGATSPGPNNWRYYRYRVYEKVIPLRNVIWGTSP